MIYFDNAATTHHKPLKVVWAMLKGITKYSANPGRSGHKLSYGAGMQVFKTREILKNFFGAQSASNILFTSGCTEALNLAILGTAHSGGHIISTVNEHNSTLRPLEYLKNTQNITYTLVKPNKSGEINAQDIKREIKPNTYLIAVNHTSNVTGATSSITQIGEIAKQNKILFLVDAAQSAGHEKINVVTQNINLLALAGHKGLLGPQGVGALITNNCPNLQPIKFGGTGTQSESIIQPTIPPEGFESGTIATPNIIAFGSGVQYVQRHFKKINCKIEKNTAYLLNQLKQIPNLILYSKNAKSGVVSFEVKNLDSNFIINTLNEKYNIATRGGYHCAPLIHKYLHSGDSLVRASLSYSNNIRQVKKLVKALKEIVKIPTF